MARLTVWLAATRPRTLAAGAAPVAVGTALAATTVPVRWDGVAACLIGAILIQIGCNFANDLGDALKGGDTPDRLGPRRAVATGEISARAMGVATAIVLAFAFLVGLWLTAIAGWPILILGVVSIVLALAYTTGPFPLAYLGLGDLFVLLFFGFAAVLGSWWVQVAAAGVPGVPPWPCWAVAGAIGLQATAILAVNNLRDLPTDGRVGKRTLAVRLGDRLSRVYLLALHASAVALFAVAAIALSWLWPAVGVAAFGAVVAGIGTVRAQGAALNPWLGRTAAVELLTAATVSISACFGAWSSAEFTTWVSRLVCGVTV